MLNGYRPKGGIHSELKQQVKKILERSEGPRAH
jgi:hypothetical protein